MRLASLVASLFLSLLGPFPALTQDKATQIAALEHFDREITAILNDSRRRLDALESVAPGVALATNLREIRQAREADKKAVNDVVSIRVPEALREHQPALLNARRQAAAALRARAESRDVLAAEYVEKYAASIEVVSRELRSRR